MERIADKSFAFAKRFLDAWTDVDTHGPVEFQNRYLFKQMIGACQFSQAYWTLYQTRERDAGRMIARHILERVFNARVAKISPHLAVELIAHDINEKIEKVELFIEQNPDLPDKNVLVAKVAELAAERKIFLDYIGLEAAPNWNYYRRAEKVHLQWAYRSMYMDFSRFVHANYELPDLVRRDEECPFANFVALFGPLDTAASLHSLTCSDGAGCSVSAEYGEILQEIGEATGAQLIIE